MPGLIFTVHPDMSGEVAERLESAAGPMLLQMRHELETYFAIPAVSRFICARPSYDQAAAVHTGAAPGPMSRYIIETTSDYARAYSALRSAFERITRAANPQMAPARLQQSITEMLNHLDVARQRLSRFLNSGETVYLTTASTRGPLLISWEYTRGGEYRVNPFTWHVRTVANPGQYVRSMRHGSPGGLAAVGPTLAMLHETSHQFGCMRTTRHLQLACSNTFEDRSAELATAGDTDDAVRGHPMIAQQGTYQNGNPGGRTVLGSNVDRQVEYYNHPEWADPADLDYVRWPTAAQLQQGIDR